MKKQLSDTEDNIKLYEELNTKKMYMTNKKSKINESLNKIDNNLSINCLQDCDNEKSRWMNNLNQLITIKTQLYDKTKIYNKNVEQEKIITNKQTKQMEELNKLKKKCVKPSRTYEECENEFKLLSNKKTIYENEKTSLDKLYIKKTDLVKDIENIQKNINKISIDINNKDLETEKQSLKNLESIYNNYQIYTQWNKYMIIVNDLKNCWEKLNSILKKIMVLTKLKDLVQQAESLSVKSVLRKLNAFANSYLQDFFIDEPMICKLVPYKETLKKQKKPSIGLEIEYKGHSLKELDTLSGGERDRVILAYTLACADIQHANLVCLDECTSSLDVESANRVFQSLKNRSFDRLYLVIAHQIVTGLFDVIEKL